MATIVTRSGKGSPLTHAEVDSNFTNLNTDKLETAGGTMTGNLSFGDNDKAIFGAGSDLQIYHNGSHSIIADVGTGNLNLYGENLNLQNSDGSENYIRCTVNGAVDIRYDNATKLATTSTGIDVTGTVTADDKINIDASNNSRLNIKETTSTDQNTQLLQSSGDLLIRTLNDAETVATNRIALDHATGDISFYEDTGTTAKFFWDASAESLGIGTSTFDNAAQVVVAKGDASVSTSDADASGFNFTAVPDTTTGKVGIGFKTFNETASAVAALYATPINQYRNALTARYNADGFGAGYFSVEQLIPASGTVQERMRIDSSGNVGIGTTTALSGPSAATALRIGNQINIYEYDDGSNPVQMNIDQNIDANENYIVTDHAARYQMRDGVHKWFTMGSGTAGTATSIGSGEAMRIDSSGNLLVGTTDIAPTSDGETGFVVRSSGYVIAGMNNQQVMLLNRSGTDGDILQFRKSGSAVGSIGSAASAYLTIGKGNTGLIFQDGDNGIQPWDISSSGNEDAALDLGKSNNRFKDLYLSGGVYLGGTGSANKLDDYETGTFTVGFSGATVTAANYTGFYTKVGQVVHWNYYSQASTISGASGSAGLTGLPFTVLNNQDAYQSIVTSHNTFFGGSATAGVSGYQNINNTAVTFLPTGGTTPSTFVNGSSLYIMVSGTYITAS